MTKSDVEILLAQRKESIKKQAHFVKKPGGYEPAQYLFSSAVTESSSGKLIQSCKIEITFRHVSSGYPTKIYINLLWNNALIYAVHYEPNQRHTNKNDTPLTCKFRDMIVKSPVHEHIFYDGASYVEPVETTNTDPQSLLNLFCDRANIAQFDWRYDDLGQQELSL